VPGLTARPGYASNRSRAERPGTGDERQGSPGLAVAGVAAFVVPFGRKPYGATSCRAQLPVVHEIPDKRATCHPRSMSFYDTCVAPRYRNGPTGRRRLTGAEAFELEGMDPCYIDIDGFWPKGANSKGPESVPIAN
jgi:hypothetical protein